MKGKVVLNNFLAGVLDPRASGRVETDAYNQGLLVGHNIELHHLGGGRRRRGLAYRTTINNLITRVSSGVTVTCPNGGTTANANDDDTATLVTTTTPPGTTNEYVVVHYDLGSAKTIVFADVLGMDLGSGTTNEFGIQYSADNVVWNHTSPGDFANSRFEVIDTTARDYRRTASVSARYWRVVRIGTTSLAANVTLTGFNLWEESANVSEGRIVPFEVSVDLRVAVVITHRSGVIWADGLVLDYIPLPYESDDIMELDADASDGEMVITHQDYAPRALFEDTADNFQSVEVFFSNVPQIDFNDSSSPTPVSEVQVITLGSVAIGDTLQVSLEGARSAVVVYAGDSNAAEQTATANNFAREIQKLYTVPGFEGVSCARTGALTYTVTFAAGSAKPYELMAVSALTGSGTTSVTRSAVGTARTEALWSATRGWPITVAFFEKRLYFFGTRSRPASVIGSHVVDTANFDLSQGLADEAVFVTLSGQSSTAQGILAGDSLQFFAVGGEYRYLKRDGEAVTPGDVPKNQSAYGSRRIRPVIVDGTTVYAHHTGKALRDYKYDVNVDKYKSLSLTSLAPHLLNDIKDIAAWNGSDEDELNFVFVVNGDGTVAVLNVREEANVKALVSWDTQGLFKAVGVQRSDIYFLVHRVINGTNRMFLEQLEYGYYTDAATQVVSDPASATVTGLGHLNGQSCRVRADGFVLANVTPSAGSATLAEGAFEEVEVGLNFNPELTPMPLNTLTPAGSNFMDKRRIVKVRAKVRGSLGLRVNGRPLPDRFWDLNNFDEPPEPFTGIHAIEESTNWDETEEKLVSFTQVDPLPMEILGIAVTMESS
jgi:hypothetical protein